MQDGEAPQEAETESPLHSRLQGLLRSWSPLTLRRSLEARLPSAAARFLRSTSPNAAQEHVMAAAPPKDPDKPWRWGESKVPGIVVHAEDGGATFPPAPLRLDLGKGNTTAAPLRKSPVTVQEWIDSLPHPETEEPSRAEEAELPVSETPDALANDTFVLGAEAVHLAQGRPPAIVVDGPAVTMSPRENGLDVAAEHPRREQFSRARTTERMASFASDSAASNASSGGVESFLESRKLDPERILLNLGFGGSQDSSGDLGLSRIPQRFLQPSQVKGISIADFYRHEMNMAQTFETGFYGYRGLTGPSHSTPSPIVAKIMERLKNRDRDYDCHSVASAPTTTMEEPSSPGVVPSSPGPFSSSPQQRFAAAAQRVQQSRSVLTRIQSWKSMQQDSTGGSVLNPDNRAFLQNQAQSKSPDVPRRKIIMGLRSYTFSGDGDLIECKQDSDKESCSKKQETATESVPEVPCIPAVKRPPPLVHKDSVLSSNTSFSEESEESDDEFRGRFRHIPEKLNSEPESPDVTTPTKLKHRHSSFNKRMSSTSVSSWESDNWLPSPPITGKTYHTFSSIDETCEDSTELLQSTPLKSKDSPTSGVFSLDNSDPNIDNVMADSRIAMDFSNRIDCRRVSDSDIPSKLVTASGRKDLTNRKVSDSDIPNKSDRIATALDHRRELSNRKVSDSDVPSKSDRIATDLDHRKESTNRKVSDSDVPSKSDRIATDLDHRIELRRDSESKDRRGSSASECNDANLVVSPSLSSRRGSLKRQSRVSSVDEENWSRHAESELKPTEPSTSQPAEMAGIAEEPCERGLSRAGSAQSDSSGFQEGEAGASAATVPPTTVVTPEEPPAATVSPTQAARIEQLQLEMAQVATGLQTFRAEILTENDPEAQARIQAKVDQISGVLLHLKSLCESLQQPEQQNLPN